MSATGRVFLTWLPPASTADLLRQEKGIAKQAEALRNVTRQRELGSVNGDLLPGIASLSAPVFNHQSNLVAAISTLGLQGEVQYRFTRSDWKNAQGFDRSTFGAHRVAREIKLLKSV